MKATVKFFKNDYEAVVQYTPNFIERLFGINSKIKTYYWNGSRFWINNERVWIDKDTGEKYGRFELLDNYIRKKK